MARRIRWQIVIAAFSTLLVFGLLIRLALASSVDSRPLVGGSYVEALVGQPIQPIPLLNDPLVDPSGRALGALLYDGLTRIGADGLPEPALAESYLADANGEVYTFNLRRDVRWHDGTPFSADDVLFTIHALQKGGLADSAFWAEVLVDRIDEHTVRFTLNEPYAPFPSQARVPILPAHLLAASPPSTWAQSAYAHQLVGTGPYKLIELNAERALLAANPDYFGHTPFIGQIELRFMATAEVAFAALRRGDLYALGGRANAELGAGALAADQQRTVVPLDEYATLSFNLRRAPLGDRSLRVALARGLDLERLREQALDGLVAPLESPILSGWWAASPTARWHAYDPAAATRTLSELGFAPGADGTLVRNGVPLTLKLITDRDPQRLATAENIAQQWRSLGVAVEVNQFDPEELRTRLLVHDFDLALHGWSRLGPDPDPFPLWHSSQADTGLNFAGLKDATIDELLVSARSDTDLAARSADYAGFQQRWIELVPAIPLYQTLYVFASDVRLQGLSIDSSGATGTPLLFGVEDRYRQVRNWYLNATIEIRGGLRK